MTTATELGSFGVIAEQERIAWASGDTAKADMLGRMADDAEALEELRTMYWGLRDLFPISSKTDKKVLLEKLAKAWELLEKAEDYAE